MKKLIYGNTIILFLGINDMITLKNGEIKKIKDDYLLLYQNCIIYNYFDLKNHKAVIRDRINKLKFKDQIIVHARKCNITHIDTLLKNKFLNENHIQGTDKSQIFYGAYFNNELIAVISFDDNMGMNGGIGENEYNLSRFSIKFGYVISGIFNRMLKSFIKDYSPRKILSFADLNFVNRDKNIYENNGFKLGKIIRPDYKIFLKNKEELYHKFTFGNKFLNNITLSNDEKQLIKDNMIKVWNCGKLRYELFINNDNHILYGYIYAIKNNVNGKIYIGQTTRTLNKRIWEYKSAYNRNIFYNKYLLNSFNKYGWDNFEFSIIDTAINLSELNNKEIEYITKYNSNNKEFGYNIESGGGNAIPTTETLEKMSKSHLGIKQNERWINNRVAKAGTDDAKKYGREKTEEEKLQLSATSPKFWQGKVRDKETKDKISKTKLENGMSIKQKEVLCKSVLKINVTTNETLNTYESTALASKNENVNQSTISRWCSKNKIINNVLWKYK